MFGRNTFMQNLNSHNFESTYKELKIDLNRLGCLMLDVKWPVGMWSPEFEGAGSDLYYAKNKDRFWINGWVADKAHLTLLYGFMKPAYKWKKYINRVLKGWKFPELEVEGIGYFDSPYKNEPYYCIVAYIKVTPELLEGHQRCQFLPHVNTFPGYRPHVTIAYIRKDSGAKELFIGWVAKLIKGKKLTITKLNFGGNK